MLNQIYQSLDPVAISFGPVCIRWYALAYLAGFLFAGDLSFGACQSAEQLELDEDSRVDHHLLRDDRRYRGRPLTWGIASSTETGTLWAHP